MFTGSENKVSKMFNISMLSKIVLKQNNHKNGLFLAIYAVTILTEVFITDFAFFKIRDNCRKMFLVLVIGAGDEKL